MSAGACVRACASGLESNRARSFEEGVVHSRSRVCVCVCVCNAFVFLKGEWVVCSLCTRDRGHPPSLPLLPLESSAPDRMLSPIHALLGEEFQDSLLPMITARMKVATLAALRATCKDGRRASTAEYDTVEAYAFFRKARDEYCRNPLFFPQPQPKKANRTGGIRYAFTAVVRSGRLRAYEQHAIRWQRHLKPEDAAAIAAEHGHVHILDWMYNQNTPRLFRGVDACRGAARGGQLETLKWLRAQLPPAPWDEKVLTDAICHGQLPILAWAAEHGCPGSHCLTDSKSLPQAWLDWIEAVLYLIWSEAKTWTEEGQEKFNSMERVVHWLGSRMTGCERANDALRHLREHFRDLRRGAAH